MSKLLVSMLWRAVRGAVATGLAAWLAAHQNDPKYLWLIPALLALGKGVREKWPKTFSWLPI